MPRPPSEVGAAVARTRRAGAIDCGGGARLERARHKESYSMSVQPLTSVSIPLQFADSASCKRWIDQLTLSNVQLTQQALTGQLAALNAAQLPRSSPLRYLERRVSRWSTCRERRRRGKHGRHCPSNTEEKPT